METALSTRTQPVLLVKKLGDETIAVRFEQVGPRYRFKIILQRFRYDFVLAECKEWDGEVWWLVAASQREELVLFTRRNGLKLVEEQEHA